jgi:hypothetical protein
MKKFFRRAVTCAALALAACSNDGGTDPDDDDFIDGTLTASVDGVGFTANLRATAVYSGNALTIDASQTTATGSKLIDLSVVNVTGPGTFTVTTAGCSAVYGEIVNSIATSWGANSFQGTGTVVITHLTSTHVMGTFSFVALPLLSGTGQRTVTNGTFSIELSSPE